MTAERFFILLSAEQHLKAAAIGQQLGLSDQWVRQVIHAFNARSVASLEPGRRARHDDQRALNDTGRGQLCDLIRQSPREHGYDTRLWTLTLLADVCCQKGWTAQRVHPDTLSQTLREMNIQWRRAKQLEQQS